jgi:CheY-like chemotaxis protein
MAGAANGSGGEGSVDAPKGRILLVEDDICIRLVAREILEGVGYTVAEAVDGLDGLTLFLENPSEVDLVILDLVMPRMHGFQVMDGIRKVSQHVPILLSSGYSPVERPEVLTPTSTLGFLPKPYRSKDLTAQVARLLGQANP